MGWFAAFVADVLYNVFRRGEKQPEYSSYGLRDHPRQIQYAPSSKSSNRSYSSEEKWRDEKHPSRHIDYSKTVVEDRHMKSDRVLQRRTAYEERRVAIRMYKDSKGKDVVEQKQYHVKKYEQHRLSPALSTSESWPGSKHRFRRQHEIVSTSQGHRK